MRMLVVMFTFSLIFFACEKESKLPDGRFIGTWTSSDPIDTLIFNSDAGFVRHRHDGINLIYSYSYTNDSITILYRGPTFPVSRPSTYHYELQEGKLFLFEITWDYNGFDQNK